MLDALQLSSVDLNLLPSNAQRHVPRDDTGSREPLELQQSDQFFKIDLLHLQLEVVLGAQWIEEPRGLDLPAGKAPFHLLEFELAVGSLPKIDDAVGLLEASQQPIDRESLRLLHVERERTLQLDLSRDAESPAPIRGE